MRYLGQLSVFCAMLILSVAVASASEETDTLLDLLGVDEMIAIMREEGLSYSQDLAGEMLPSGNSATWDKNIAKIYDRTEMTLLAQGGFAKALEGADLAPMMALFESEAGARLVQLEISARRAMLDESIEENAKQTASRLEIAGDARFLLVEELIEAGDMIEANVVSALNSNIFFYEGLVDGGAFRLSDEEIIADVWSQEDETRIETRDWLFGFFLLAYGPLPHEEIEQFVAFSKTAEGRVLSRAIIAAYDGMYADISYALGRAVAQEMQAEEI